MRSHSPDEEDFVTPDLYPAGTAGARTSVDRMVLLLAMGIGTGRAPVAPGTVGSLLGPPLVWGLQEAGVAGWTWGAAAILLWLIGVPVCGRAATLLHAKDPGCVVYDEIAAFPVVFALTDVNWLTALLGFAFFRLFDIWKPWPVRQAERLSGGCGIMADDVVAAVYAAAALWLSVYALD